MSQALSEARPKPFPETAPEVILASASPARRRLLAQAGIACEAVPASIDEAGVKASLLRDGRDGAQAATALAELKAQLVSAGRAGALVIGADQLLVCGADWYGKPGDMARARADLQALRGREHELITAACLARDGAVIWHHVARARLIMRRFSDDFLDRYLEGLGAAALRSVGAYEIEGPGAQLFSRIDGDYFTILGLPLLPLLEVLRVHKVIGE